MIASAVLLPRVSVAAEMLAKDFSSLLAPNQGRNHLAREWNVVSLSVIGLLCLILRTNVHNHDPDSQVTFENTEILGVMAPKVQVPDQPPGNVL